MASGRISKRSRERVQWADLDKHREDIHLVGRGEGRATVYFGMGFSSPPVLDFSAIMNHEVQDTVPSSITAPRGSLDKDKDANGHGNDSQMNNDIIGDPGFEGQSQWATLFPQEAITIPTAQQVMQLAYDESENGGNGQWPLMQAWDDDTPSYEWAFRYYMDYSTMGAHQWVQTDENRERWSTTNAQSHDLGVGESGKYSAHSVIGANGYTNWLVPVDRVDRFWGGLVYMADPANSFDYSHLAEHCLVTCEELTSSLWGGFGPGSKELFTRNEPPPFLGGFDGFAYVKSDENCTLESKAVYHHWDGEEVERGDPSEIVFTDEAAVWSWYGSSINEDNTSAMYRLVANVTDSRDVEGGDWRRTQIELPYEGKRAFPTPSPELYRRRESWPQFPFWRLMFRVKGTPGTNVYLDNVYVWREVRNQGAPSVTVGVAEWLRDEAGVYIGADLWFKVGNPRLGG